MSEWGREWSLAFEGKMERGGAFADAVEKLKEKKGNGG
jgi:hypothetical protein